MTTCEAILLMTNVVAIFLWVRKDVIDEKNIRTYIKNEEGLEEEVSRLREKINKQAEDYDKGIREAWALFLSQHSASSEQSEE